MTAFSSQIMPLYIFKTELVFLKIDLLIEKRQIKTYNKLQMISLHVENDRVVFLQI